MISQIQPPADELLPARNFLRNLRALPFHEELERLIDDIERETRARANSQAEAAVAAPSGGAAKSDA